jgi:hypothetical protein
MKRRVTIVKRALAGVAILLGVAYAGDYLWVRIRMAYPKAGGAVGSVQMDRLYAIPQKNGKIDYEFDAQQPEVNMPCVHSWFPHAGYSPCWYLARNRHKPIPMIILRFAEQGHGRSRLAHRECYRKL